MTDRIAPPRPPEAPPPFRFPVLAMLAPVVASVAIWAITQSPFALLFAVLGPVTAVASLADARVGARRTARRELARYLADAAGVRERIAAAHRRELADLLHAVAPVAELDRSTVPRWSADPAHAIPIALGTGAVPSLVAFPPDTDLDGPAQQALAELAEQSSTLPDAPVVVDARLGIGVIGTPVAARAVLRGLVAAVARSLAPEATRIGSSLQGEEWLAALPHTPDAPPPSPRSVRFRAGDRSVALLAWAERREQLPAGCGVVVQLDAGGGRVVAHPDRARCGPLRLTPFAAQRALALASALAGDAIRDGRVQHAGVLPTGVALERLPVAPARGLAATVGTDGDGPVELDLVAQGPHAVVGGTTGSGKSEFLVAWVLAMAAAHPPERFTVLLIDFKGGAAFARLADLAHTVGVVTDLDDAGATRALDSLRAELRHRERRLVEAGVTDVDGVPGLPRLVLVVDEFAAMLAERPQLHELFADLAARGRALGVHLVLCTQRPGGAIRDAVLANADLRICLRVNNRADSSAVVGVDAAAEIPADLPGRALVAVAGTSARLVQFAIADPAAPIPAWPGSPPPRRPWLPPLPTLIEPHTVAGFGVLDLPDEQRQRPAQWIEPHVLVLGAAGSGLSTALAALGGPAARWLPDDSAAAWDAIEALPDRADEVLLLDDADALLARMPGEYRAEAADRLAAALRDGPARGLRFAIAARRLTPELQPLAALAPTRLYLRHGARHDVLLAGGTGDDFIAGLPPGGGSWSGRRVQVVAATPRRATAPPEVHELDDRPLAIVSTRPSVLARRIPSRFVDEPPTTDAALLGSPDDWQAHWGLLPALRDTAQVLFDACAPADYRALTRSRMLPPLLHGHPELAWRLEPDGSAVRVRLPGAPARAAAAASQASALSQASTESPPGATSPAGAAPQVSATSQASTSASSA